MKWLKAHEKATGKMGTIGARYDKQDVKLAWQRTMAFFKENLGG